MIESRGEFYISMLVDADLAGYKSVRRIQTGVLIIINKATIHWYSKIQTNFESSTFGAWLCAMKAGVEMFESLRYKL